MFLSHFNWVCASSFSVMLPSLHCFTLSINYKEDLKEHLQNDASSLQQEQQFQYVKLNQSI